MNRSAVIDFRLRACGLVRRLPRHQIVRAAERGLQDSAPRSAVLGLHARVDGIRSGDWEHPELVQVWGPRAAIYVVPAAYRGVFTLGLTPRDRAEVSSLKKRIEDLDKALGSASAGDVLPTALVGSDRYAKTAAAISGRIRLRWDGSAINLVVAEPPDITLADARTELARRFLHAFGPVTPRQYARWAGVSPADARATFHELREETLRVTIHGDTRVLLEDDAELVEDPAPMNVVRLLPPGDPYLTGPDCQIIASDPDLRKAVWPQSVPPGAVLVGRDLVATWRRQGASVVLTAWRSLGTSTLEAIESEALSLPIEGSRDASWANLER